MAKPKPLSEQVLEFLRGNLGKHCLAPLTGTDYRALMAAAHLMEAYSGDGHPCYLEAFRLTVQRMQPKCWYFAYHTIAKALDWGDRMDLWMKAGLPTEPLENTPRCEFEPGGAARAHTAAGETRQLLEAAAVCRYCRKRADEHYGESRQCVGPDGTVEALTFQS